MRKGLVISIVFVVVVILVILIVFLTKQGCTKELNLCQDGSSVGRNSSLNCEFNSCPEPEFVQTEPALITSDEVRQLRIDTYDNCQGLINQTVNFFGTVMYQECGKNCLGGCPNTGPAYCYYGIQDENNCLVYIPNAVLGFYISTGGYAPAKFVNRYQFGDQVEITDKITLYVNSYCNEDPARSGSQCTYFMLGSDQALFR